jgi:hypothetical protein
MLLKVVIIDYVMRNRRSNNELDKIGQGIEYKSPSELSQDMNEVYIIGIDCYEPSNTYYYDIIVKEFELDKVTKLQTGYTTLDIVNMIEANVECPLKRLKLIGEIFTKNKGLIHELNLKLDLQRLSKDFPKGSMIRMKCPRMREEFYYIHSYFINKNDIVYANCVNSYGFNTTIGINSLYMGFDIITEEDISIYDKTYMIGKFVDSLGMVLDCLPKDKYK